MIEPIYKSDTKNVVIRLRAIGGAITKWGAIEKSTILLLEK
jgi:hypothetical protein